MTEGCAGMKQICRVEKGSGGGEEGVEDAKSEELQGEWIGIEEKRRDATREE